MTVNEMDINLIYMDPRAKETMRSRVGTRTETMCIVDLLVDC